jgi:hypothetical protein
VPNENSDVVAEAFHRNCRRKNIIRCTYVLIYLSYICNPISHSGLLHMFELKMWIMEELTHLKAHISLTFICSQFPIINVLFCLLRCFFHK